MSIPPLDSNLQSFLSNVLEMKEKIKEVQRPLAPGLQSMLSEVLKVNREFEEEQRPLREARKKIFTSLIMGEKEKIQEWLETEPDVNAPIDEKCMPLDVVIFSHQLDLIPLLLEHGADPNKMLAGKISSPFHMAVQLFETKALGKKTIDLLIEKGADPDIPFPNGVVPRDVLDGKTRCSGQEENSPSPTPLTKSLQ